MVSKWIKRMVLGTLMAALLISTPAVAAETNIEAITTGVTHLYQTALGRYPDEQGKQDWIQAASTGCSWTDVVKGFVFSSEVESQRLSNEKFVELLYAAGLYRQPEKEEKIYWIKLLDSGESRQTISDGILYSEEFIQLCKANGLPTTTSNLTPVNYISDQVIIQFNEQIQIDDTLSGQDAMNGLLAQLPSNEKNTMTSICSVVISILTPNTLVMQINPNLSVENAIGQLQPLGTVIQAQPNYVYDLDEKDYISSFVERLYKLCLGRTADEEGMEYWSNQLCSGSIGGKDTANGFFFSNEFQNMNTDNEEYVVILYKVMLNRSPDTAGYRDWVSRLESGASRTDVFNGFGNSVEFGKLCENYGIPN